MKQSNYDVNKWLSSIFTKGETPSGECVEVIRVADGESVEVWSGGSYFGSGGGYVDNRFTSENEPEEDESKHGKSTDNGFVSETSRFLIMKSPMVIYTESGDGINGGRVFYQKAFVCASDEMIQAAKISDPFIPTGWSLEMDNDAGYLAWFLKPHYWHDSPVDTGLKLAKETYGAGGKVTLIYFPEDGSQPIPINEWRWFTECYCEARWDETGELQCTCEKMEIPETIERAVELLEIDRQLRKALCAYMKKGQGMMQAIKIAAALAQKKEKIPVVKPELTTMQAAYLKAVFKKQQRQ